MKIETGSKLVMIGDSITDAERARPIGEGLFGALGQGICQQCGSAYRSGVPHSNIRLVNMGSSGNTIRDLKARWQTDALDLHPDWLSIMIGTNDVWRQFDSPQQKHTHVYPDEYAATLDELVFGSLPHLNGLVLMTPFYIEPNPHDAMRAQMDRYGRIVREIAERHGALFVDTQAAFNRLCRRTIPRPWPGIASTLTTSAT